MAGLADSAADFDASGGDLGLQDGRRKGFRVFVWRRRTRIVLSLIGWPLAGTAPAELEYGPVARAQLADVAGYSSSYLVAGTLGLNV